MAQAMGEERARKRAAFITNPFAFMKQLLGFKHSGRLSYAPEEVDCFLKNNLSDPEKEQALDLHKAFISPPPPTVDFDLRELSLKDVQKVIKGARTASTPGPSGVPYLVYKCCPDLLRQHWKIIRVIWGRESCQPVEVHRGSLDHPQGGKLEAHQAVLYHLTA